MSRSRRIFLIAGEPSGDRLGAALMAGLKMLSPDIRFSGIGGRGMEAEGMTSLFPMSDLSVMGLAEVLPKLRALFARRDQAVAAILADPPDALVTIDSPDFCLRVAKRVRAEKTGVPIIHYVAPSVWAWRPGRARQMGAFVDHVLALLPFEPPLMQAAGMGCDFVGHPASQYPVASAAEARAFRASCRISADAEVLIVLPGSRKSEVTRLMPRFGQALEMIRAAHDRPIRVVIPAADGVAELVAGLAAEHMPGALVLDPRGMSPAAAEKRKFTAFGAARAGLAASGTVSLELAAAGLPSVIAYDMSPLSRLIIGAMLKTDTVTLTNLVSETRAVPELIGRRCRPIEIFASVMQTLVDPEMRDAQIRAAELTMERLGRGAEAPGIRAARAVLSQMP